MRFLIYYNTTQFKNGGRVFARGIRWLLALLVVAWVSLAPAAQTKVIINLSEQRAYLVEQGRVTLVSPIASGKPGWSTPTGNFSIFNKDIDHRSRSFGSVVDTYGGVVNGNATPSSRVPRGCHYRPAPMPYFMEFSSAVGMHAGYLPGYPASHGCVRMPRDYAALFFERVPGFRRNLEGTTKLIPLYAAAIFRFADQSAFCLASQRY